MSLLNKLPSGLCVNDPSTASINQGMYRKVHNTHSSVAKLKAKLEKESRDLWFYFLFQFLWTYRILDGFYSPYKDNWRLRGIEENERCVDK